MAQIINAAYRGTVLLNVSKIAAALNCYAAVVTGRSTRLARPFSSSVCLSAPPRSGRGGKLQFCSTEDFTVAQNFNFALKFPQNGNDFQPQRSGNVHIDTSASTSPSPGIYSDSHWCLCERTFSPSVRSRN